MMALVDFCALLFCRAGFLNSLVFGPLGILYLLIQVISTKKFILIFIFNISINLLFIISVLPCVMTIQPLGPSHPRDQVCLLEV